MRTTLDTYVSLYSNKASAGVTLQGTTWFKVVLSDRGWADEDHHPGIGKRAGSGVRDPSTTLFPDHLA